MSQAQILVVDDEPDIRQLVQEILEDEGYSVQVAADGESARLMYARQKPDLVLLDIWMPDIDGISLLKEWSAAGKLESQVVIMSGHGTLETAVEATRLGAFDFVQKPLSLAKLLATVRKALDSKPQGETATSAQHTQLTEPLGTSPAMQVLRNQARQAAGNASPVMITGEPGSGRRTLAQYIHQLSGSAGEMAIFDHNQPIAALLDQASNGTLFIPDLTKLPADTQELLNSTIEFGSYTSSDGTEQKSINCRIVCSANEDIENAVSEGKLLGSLYFRLNVLPLEIPPLRERAEDIPDLVRFFSDWFPNQEGLPYRQFSVSVQNRLRNHTWPGNVRELRNLIQRLLVLGGDGEISMQEIEDALSHSAASHQAAGSDREALFDLPLREAREQFERDYLIYQLKKAGGSVGKLSASVEMERTHLYRKLRSLGIDPKSVTRGDNKP
jgi:DNA-binding NtrC family response regulator